MRRIPIFATIVVIAAVATMLALGVWQLGRMHQKEALLKSYAAAKDNPGIIDWVGAGVSGGKADSLLYRRARLDCPSPIARSSMAGRNAAGQSGVAQTVQCPLTGGVNALVVLGWSLQPTVEASWQGGEVTGIIAPGPRLVADPALEGLGANAVPDPSELPNNHFAYAFQWFFFAATALVIYVLALRRRK